MIEVGNGPEIDKLHGIVARADTINTPETANLRVGLLSWRVAAIAQGRYC